MRQLLPTKQETFSKQTDNEAHFTQQLARCVEMVGLFPQVLFFHLTTYFTLHVYDCMQRCQKTGFVERDQGRSQLEAVVAGFLHL